MGRKTLSLQITGDSPNFILQILTMFHVTYRSLENFRLDYFVVRNIREKNFRSQYPRKYLNNELK